MDPLDRSRIVTLLYNDVVRAQQAMQETRHISPQAHGAAKEVLERAVRRYTDFTLDGNIPEDLRITIASAPGVQRESDSTREDDAR